MTNQTKTQTQTGYAIVEEILDDVETTVIAVYTGGQYARGAAIDHHAAIVEEFYAEELNEWAPPAEWSEDRMVVDVAGMIYSIEETQVVVVTTV